MSGTVSKEVTDQFCVVVFRMLTALQIHYWAGPSTETKMQQAVLESQHAKREAASAIQSMHQAIQAMQESKEIAEQTVIQKKEVCNSLARTEHAYIELQHQVVQLRWVNRDCTETIGNLKHQLQCIKVQTEQDARTRQQKDQKLQETSRENSALRKALWELQDRCVQLESRIQQTKPNEHPKQVLPDQFNASSSPMDAENERRGRDALRSASEKGRRSSGRKGRDARSTRDRSATCNMVCEMPPANDLDAEIIAEEAPSIEVL